MIVELPIPFSAWMAGTDVPKCDAIELSVSPNFTVYVRVPVDDDGRGVAGGFVGLTVALGFGVGEGVTRGDGVGAAETLGSGVGDGVAAGLGVDRGDADIDAPISAELEAVGERLG